MGRGSGKRGEAYLNMICDFHVQYIPESVAQHTSFFKGVWSDKDALLKFLDEKNISCAHLVYPSTDAHIKMGWDALARTYNEAIAALVKAHPKRLIGSAILPLQTGDIKTQLSGIKGLGFQGVSLSSSYDGAFAVERFREIFALACNLNMAVFIHPQTINPIGFERVKDPLLMPVLEYSLDTSMCLGLCMMEGIFQELPNLKIVFSSLGGVIPFLKDRFDGVYAMLRKRNMVKDLGKSPSEILKSVYVDTSGIKSPEPIQCALDFFGEDHILFASDYPANQDIQSQLGALKHFSAQTQEKILSKNFLELFNTSKQ